MTRKEQEILKEKNYIKKRERIIYTLQVFMDNDGKITDEQLADKLLEIGVKTSSSTVGRDLSENLEKMFLEENKRKNTKNNALLNLELTTEQASIIAFAKKKRKDNKHSGQVRGGTCTKRGEKYEK